MKKLLILIFIALMLLASCSAGGNKPDISSQKTGSSDTNPSTGTGPASETDTSAPDTSALEKVGDQLWEIPLPDYLTQKSSSCTADELYTRGDYLLAAYSDSQQPSDESILLLFDITTGAVISESRQNRMNRIALLDDGYISVIDNSTLKTVIYDRNFAVTAEYPAVGSDIMTTLAFVSCDRNYFVWYSDDAHVMIKDLSADTVTDLGETASDPCFCSEYNGIAYLMSYNSGENVNYALDLKAKALTRLDEFNGMGPVGLCIPAYVHSEMSSAVMLQENPGGLYIFDNSDMAYPSDYRDGCFAAQLESDDDAETVVCLTSAVHSKRVSVTLPSDAGHPYIGFIRMADHGEVFIDTAVDYEHPRLFLWLPESASSSESVGITVTDRAGLLAQTESMKKTIKDTYGINLFYGAEGSGFNAYDYTGEMVTDEIRIYNAVKILYSTLSKYPHGIFREMLDPQLIGFNFYLCGKLTGVTDNTVSSALAITFTDYETNTKRIACDIGGYYMLDQTIAHELMHVMDDAILNAEADTGIPYYSLWLGLLPSGVDYYYYYVDANGNEPSDSSYTVMGEANADNIYFIDAYSKTYPTEDRARIMEYLFKTENGVLSASIRGDHLIEKCRALCIILRKVFPSVASESEVFWESGLGVIDESELDGLIARYREFEKNRPAAG